jgi:hypothetical protein
MTLATIGTGIVLFSVLLTFLIAGDEVAELYQRVSR